MPRLSGARTKDLDLSRMSIEGQAMDFEWAMQKALAADISSCEHSLKMERQIG